MADAQGKVADVQIKGMEAQLTLPDKLNKIKFDNALTRAKANKLTTDMQKTALDLSMEVDGTKHMREMEKAKAQAKGNMDLEIMKALGKPSKLGEKDPDIDAMVGFNYLNNNL
mgnify:CR=1 FL=1